MRVRRITRCFLLERCAEMMEDLSGHRPSTGGPSNFQQGSPSGPEHYEQAVKKLLPQGPALHADGTGLCLNGENGRMHMIGNKASIPLHIIQSQAKRPWATSGHYRGTLVHDRFGSRFSYQYGHGLCNAHTPRALAYVGERLDTEWAGQVKSLPMRAKAYKENGPNVKSSY